jgi:hypothetical protein
MVMMVVLYWEPRHFHTATPSSHIASILLCGFLCGLASSSCALSCHYPPPFVIIPPHSTPPPPPPLPPYLRVFV